VNLCKNGHDKDAVGVINRQCRRCANDQKNASKARARIARSRAKRLKQCDHSGTCAWVTSRSGGMYCATQKRASAAIAPIKKVDGFEDEYGPIPPRVKDADWYDWVIVEGVLSGIRVSRPPYPKEWEEILTRNTKHLVVELAMYAGVDQDTVINWNNKIGVK
jgi:hypothetical protein